MRCRTVDRKKLLKWGLVFGFIAVLVPVYKLFDPAGYVCFPKCPFKVLTGLDCPGCGSQRAIHALLNFDLASALKQNALMVLSVPYLAAGFAFDIMRHPGVRALKWRKRLFGERAVYVILVLIALYTIGRNILPIL